MMQQSFAILGLGSNLAAEIDGALIQPAQIMAMAKDALARHVRIVAKSKLYSSPAWPDPSAPPYVNAALLVAMIDLGAAALLACCQQIELAFGRARHPNDQWAARTLDIDILAYGTQADCGLAIESPNLCVPHPRLMQRAFQLGPLIDVCPDWVHPISGKRATACFDDGVEGGDALKVAADEW